MVVGKNVHEVAHEHTSRVTSFSDGVFAIAITILVLNLKVTEGVPLGLQLAAQWDYILSIGITFFVIAAAWIAHHRFFRYVKRYDDTVLWLNNLFLFWIALFPFLTLVISEFSASKLAAFLYASGMTAASLTFWLLWKYCEKSGFIDNHLKEKEVRRHERRALIGAMTFGASIIVLFWSVPVARFLWLVAIFVFFISDYIYRALSVVRSD